MMWNRVDPTHKRTKLPLRELERLFIYIFMSMVMIQKCNIIVASRRREGQEAVLSDVKPLMTKITFLIFISINDTFSP